MKKGLGGKSLIIIFTLCLALFVFAAMEVYGRMNRMNREKALRFYTDRVAASMDLSEAFEENVTVNDSAPSFNSSYDFQNHRIRGRTTGFEHSLRGGWGTTHIYNTFHISSNASGTTPINGSEIIVVRNGEVVRVIESKE